ncbi:MAG: putative transporter [Chthoniobacterales bacterium]|nr:putative transporter [Chthoniobacterales bacterium]
MGHFALAQSQPVAWAVLVLSAVAIVGLAIASIKVRGVGIGIAGVLFAGIIAGHLGFSIDHSIMEFVREFGLILFVFTIGLQLGPSFFASLRSHGLKFNALAAAVVVLGAGITLAFAALSGVDVLSACGLFSGATTNTPSLGATQQTVSVLASQSGSAITPDRAALPALAYAVGYPVGVFGIIGVMLFFRKVFRVDLGKEVAAFRAEQLQGIEPLDRMSLVVENANLDGIEIGDIPGRHETGVMVSRIKRNGAEEVEVATERTIVHKGDKILAVGPRRQLEAFRLIVGRESSENLMRVPGRVAFRRVVVTRKEVLGKTVAALGLDVLYGVAVTRVLRADVEMTAVPDLQLQFGDFLHVVGDEDNIAKAADLLGNSLQALNETKFIPMFVGILLGVTAGLVPFQFPGLPVPVRLGLAGGPLVLAILLGRIGRIGPLVWYMPANANLALRELGIVLFLACVGLKAGEKFVPTLLSHDGLFWLGGAFAIALLPLLAVGLFARLALRVNFIAICGLLAGSMTDPPALAFANAISKSDAPSVAYATVYPLTMLLRIISAQILVLLLAG